MRSVTRTFGLVLAGLLLVTGSALAATIGGESTGTSIDGQELEIAQGMEVAGVELEARSERTDLGAKAPVCEVETDHDYEVHDCAGPEVETNAAPPTLNVDVFVAFGNLAALAEEEPEEAVAAANAFAAPDAATPTLLLVTAAGASAGLLYAAWRALKFLGVAGFIPLYSQISDDEMLNDPTRAAIVKVVRETPGISTKELAARLDLAWGTVTHHLAKLEKRRFLVSKKYGKYRRFFVNGAAPPDADPRAIDAEASAAARTRADGVTWRDALAVLRVDKTAHVERLVRQAPGLTQKEVSEILGVSSSTVLWHVKRLEAVGLVRKERDGKSVRYYPNGAEPAPRLTPTTAVPA